MKIIQIPSYFPPEKISSSILDDQLRQSFADAGIDMVIYTPTPTRNVSEEDKIKYKDRREELMYDGHAEVYRFPLMQESKNPILRALRYFLQNYKQYRLGIKRNDVDVIFCGSTPPTQGLVGVYMKKRMQKKYGKKIPLIYNLHDVFPDSLVGTGLAKKGGLLWKIGSWVANTTYRNADKIIAISEDIKRNVIQKGVPEEKVTVAYNWIDAHVIKPVEKGENTLFDEFGISRDIFTVVYAGNLGNAQNINIILDASKELPDVQFVIFGSQGLEQDIRKRIDNEQLQNVKLLPLQPLSRVGEVYSVGDACVVSCKEGLGGSAMPSKTWTIMACERPVLANFDEGELKEILEDNACGLFSHAGKVEEFVATIKEFSCNQELCKKMGKNARKFILDNLTKEVGTQRYVDVIKSFEKV